MQIQTFSEQKQELAKWVKEHYPTASQETNFGNVCKLKKIFIEKADEIGEKLAQKVIYGYHDLMIIHMPSEYDSEC